MATIIKRAFRALNHRRRVRHRLEQIRNAQYASGNLAFALAHDGFGQTALLRHGMAGEGRGGQEVSYICSICHTARGIC